MGLMKLPTEYQLMGKTVKVKEVDCLVVNNDADGEHHPRLDEIHIQKNSPAWPRSEDQLGEAFWHEVTHSILDAMEEKKINENERFVTLFGNLLYQVIKTMK